MPASCCRPSSVALSVSLPLRTEPFVGALARNWFGNLLPEGPVREAIAARLRIPVKDILLGPAQLYEALRAKSQGGTIAP